MSAAAPLVCSADGTRLALSARFREAEGEY